MLNRPAHIPASISQAPLTFPWSNEIALRLDGFDAVPPRLGRALAKVSYKGRLALALGCLEWITWRLSGLVDVQDTLLRLEAAWASQVAVAYTRDLDVDAQDDINKPGDPHGPLQEVQLRLEMLHFMYAKAKPEMSVNAGLCALLASHVLPPDCGFEAWLERLLVALAEADPCSPDFSPGADVYDYSAETPVPRAWLERLDVPRDPATSAAEWNAFFQAADPATNPYLVTADEMRAEGFSGEPYVFA